MRAQSLNDHVVQARQRDGVRHGDAKHRDHPGHQRKPGQERFVDTAANERHK